MMRLFVVLLFCSLCVWASTVYEVQVQVLIDGDSQLILQGNTVQWHNLSWCAPGRHLNSCGDTNQPTVISTWLNGVADLAGYQWTPNWPSGISGDKWSDSASVLSPALPGNPLGISLATTSARGGASIVEDPQTSGRYILSFFDNPIGGSAVYDVKFTLRFADGPVDVPEPATAWLLVGGALGLGLLRRR